MSKRFSFRFNMFFDLETLNFPKVHLKGGMEHLYWREDCKHPDGTPYDNDHDCYGIGIQIHIWFIQVMMLITPFVKKTKRREL